MTIIICAPIIAAATFVILHTLFNRWDEEIERKYREDWE